jgi:ABC-2 type transport system ATP-binding protein
VRDPVLRCEGLRKAFGGRAAVDGVGIEIGRGETYGLLGPNGAGKTTTISMIAGVLRRDSGTVVVDGHSIDDDHDAASAAIGYVPQDLALYPDLTARENLRFFGRLYGLRRRELEERTDAVLATVGLSERADDRVDTYSGGMKRRANIAAGLLHRPALLILDEPTVGVDPQSRNAILESVEQLGEAGLAVLYTTHYMEEAQRLCDRIGIIDEGRLVAEGTHRDLVALVGRRDRVHIEVDGNVDALATAAAELPGVDRATPTPEGVEVVCDNARTVLPRLVELAERDGLVLHGLEVRQPDLEAAFLHLTGKALRD